MRTQELLKQYNRLVALFDKTEEVTSGDLEAQAHWAKYLCVLSAGFLENALQEVYRQYCARSSNQNVSRFTGKVLEKVLNPNIERFLKTAHSFRSQWRDELESFVEDDGRKEAVNSIIRNRHKIAHGKDSDISLVRVKEYFEKSVEVVEFIEQQCGF